jgi:hypothetical protein
MTILQMVLFLAIFQRALRAPAKPVRDRERSSGDGDRVDN